MSKRLVVFGLIIIGAFIAFSLVYSTHKSELIGSQIPDSKFNGLVWADEFNGIGAIDTSKWFQQTKIPPGGSWWGGLIQHYTDRTENSYVKDGFLNLIAIKESYEDQSITKEYTSARLNSKFAFTYGRVEIRAKLPEGIGTWPAIWMLNKNISEDGAYWETQGFGKVKWPICGEIDILEHWGNKHNYIQSAVHTGSSFGDNVKNLGGREVDNVSSQFHIYAIEWSEDKLIFSVDDIIHYVYQPTIKMEYTWPFNSDMYVIFNIAILPSIDPQFVQSAMLVDYIRIYQ